MSAAAALDPHDRRLGTAPVDRLTRNVLRLDKVDAGRILNDTRMFGADRIFWRYLLLPLTWILIRPPGFAFPGADTPARALILRFLGDQAETCVSVRMQPVYAGQRLAADAVLPLKATSIDANMNVAIRLTNNFFMCVLPMGWSNSCQDGISQAHVGRVQLVLSTTRFISVQRCRP